MGKRLLLAGLILIAIALLLNLPGILRQIHGEQVISQYDCLDRERECLGASTSVGQIALSIEPVSLPAMQPLSLTVNVSDRRVESVKLQFIGRDMNMGLQPVTLIRNADNKDLWQGEGVISLCTVDADMVWLARVTVMASGKPYVVEFVLGPATH
ncbi:hypothetical protein [Kistimonas asteriae]|uniref:hypothetical protein n=1 Tax=Kistimonas asteriae TaxID=517724 RepID=UPI001BA7451D|nr:hypothetical protein [Kistimonas asteriae]